MTARAFDYRDWSRATWLTVNAGALAILVAVRFLPDVASYCQKRRNLRTQPTNGPTQRSGFSDSQ